MWGIYSSLLAAFKRKRKCSQCGKITIVSLKDKDKAVKCDKCGKSLPPQGPSA